MKAPFADKPARHWLEPWHVDPRANREYDFIDGLRGLAILVVLVCHSIYAREQTAVTGRFLLNFSGTLGNEVGLFFTLSGFLISWPFWKRKVNRAGSLLPPGYGWRRFWKIYPPLALSVLLLTPCYILSFGDAPLFIRAAVQWFTGLAFLMPVSGKLNPVMWSLVVEIHFYLVLPLLFLLTKPLSARTCLWVISLFLFAGPVSVQALTGLIPIPYDNRYKYLVKGMTAWQTMVMARKRTKLTLSPAEAAELKAQIRAATDPRDKERLQVVLWATSGQHSLAALAELAGRARSTIQVWLDDFTAGGVGQLLERTPPPGKPSLVAGAKVQAELQAGLQAGHWRTAGQVAAWLQEKHGIKRAAKSLYYWLGKAGGALRVPRPCHVQQNPAATAAFRAELEANLEKLELPKDRPVKIWVADEARFGLHTQSRRCWALRGQRVVIPQQQRYEWEYVYGALEVLEGDAQFRFMPSVNLDFSRDFLQQIAASDPAAEHVVIQDQAGFHPRRGDAGLPARIHLLPLPPYSPELNPIEGLWDQVQDVTCNRRHESLDDLEQTLTTALRPFWETPARVLSLIHHWLRSQANATP